ncbi:hypothetical protein A11M_0118210 [Xanthomonas vasicola pv. vasculorum NCPPB 895]|uniref:Transposase n=1 Tax=Xanthomonas vasicola pv. vasculorum NCPPB 890 TaxID=1184265 RepID=A0A836P500_XANVA|nr:hypothetical protein A11M_0118210 [Xanthomonas vasicola pv. vasculorum NCPPB 895]KFA26890.1 hypothetical protein KWG_0122950 [Xanthomonas vasicola pv. vasculorum NCPPB 1381]KFA28390.1 hypothetical protein KW5_0110240 [Xanthomonas vasicola pv. vasculorum NCPPB 1326]
MGYRLRRQRSIGKRRLVEGSALFQSLRDDLVFQRWSPQQIAAKPKVLHPDDPAQRVSHETIYAAIYTYPRGGLKRSLSRHCDSIKPARGRRRTTATKRSWVPEELRIIHRAEQIEQRLIS